MNFSWPDDAPNIPDAPWVHSVLEQLAEKYDTVEEHGWYDNLNPTVDQILADADDDYLLLDYSGGTGILADRILRRAPDKSIGVLIADSSPKFLRLALEKLRHDPRVGYRLISYLRSERRLQTLQEVMEPSLQTRGVDAIASTNAIHLYYGLSDTLRSWHEVLRPGGKLFVQSGNVHNPNAAEGSWIIDLTVEHIHRIAMDMVRDDDSLAHLRHHLADADYMAAHDKLRAKYFLPVRPVAYYVDALREAGFTDVREEAKPVRARCDDWYDFLAVYHEGVLGWVGGAEKITGEAASDETITLRKALMWRCMQSLFDGADDFEASWTYITATRT